MNDHNWVQSCPAEKLLLDFANETSMCGGMPTSLTREQFDLITGLCLEAGRLMEDESPALALTLPESTTAIAVQLATARQAGEDISTLAAAAQVLLRRRETGS